MKVNCDRCKRKIDDARGEKFVCCSCCGEILCYECAGIKIEYFEGTEEVRGNQGVKNG